MLVERNFRTILLIARFGLAALVFTIVAFLPAPPPATLASSADAPAPPALRPGAQTGGMVWAVAAAGGRAYLGVGRRIEVFDVSDPRAPVRVGRTGELSNLVHDVAVAGTVAYVLTGDGSLVNRNHGGLHVIDVADPTRPIERSYWPCPDATNAVVVGDGVAYVIGYAVHALDVADPDRPRLLSTFERDRDNFPAMRIATAGGNVFFSDVDRLRVVDYSVPHFPRPLGEAMLHTPGVAMGIVVEGDRLYVLMAIGGIEVFDVGDLAHPRSLGMVQGLGALPLGMDVVDGVAVVTGSSLLYVVSASKVTSADPNVPVSIEMVGETGWDVSIENGMAFVAGASNGLHIFDVSTPDSPARAAEHPVLGIPDIVAAGGGFVGAVSGSRRWVYLFSDTPDMSYLGRVWVPSYVRALSLSEGHAFVATDFQLLVFDLEHPSRPRQVSSLVVSRAPSDMVVAGGVAFIATDGNGLEIVDVADPTAPRAVAKALPGARLLRVAVEGATAYVAGQDPRDERGGALWVVDVRDPRQPVELGLVNAPDPLIDIAVVGSFAYVATAGRLGLYDLADPSRPRSVSLQVPVTLTVRRIESRGRWLYVLQQAQVATDGPGAVDVLDVTQPYEPRPLAHVGTPPQPQDLTASGWGFYVAGGGTGLRLWEWAERERVYLPSVGR